MSPNIYCRQLLKISVSQLLQTVGFQSVHGTALDILVEVLERYLTLISKSCHDYAEFANRTEPTLDDVACAFQKYKINLNDLDEFIKYVDTPEFQLKKHNSNILKTNMIDKLGELIPIDPKTGTKIKKKTIKSNLDYLGYCDDPTNKELLDRQSDEENEYIYDYMPLMTKTKTLIEEPVLNETLNQQKDVSMMIETKQTDNDQIQDESSDIIKNGTKFKKSTWKSLYEPKFVLQHKLIESKQNTPIQSTAKLPAHFHKPRSKYKKQIYSNAIQFCNKSNPNLLLNNECLKQLEPEPGEMIDIQETCLQNMETNEQDIQIQDQQQQQQQQTQQSKSNVDQMLESLMTKYTSQTTTTTATSSTATLTSQSSSNLKLKITQQKEVLNINPSFSLSLDDNLTDMNSIKQKPLDLSKNTQIPKLKISTKLTMNNKEEKNEQINLINSNYDDENALDGLGETKLKSSSTTLNEPLIWKPICHHPTNNTDNNTDSSLISPIKNDLKNQPPPPSLSTFITKPIVDYSSNSNESEHLTVVKKKDEQTVVVNENEQNVVKHKKKKKNKDKSKNKDKDKERDKDKDKDKKHHHHHHHHKKKDKEKEKLKDESNLNNESQVLDEDEIKRREEKKLKKLMKKEKKKLLENSAKSESSLLNNSDNLINKNDSIQIESQTSDLNNKLIKSDLINQTQQQVNVQPTPPPPLPKLKLKINTEQAQQSQQVQSTQSSTSNQNIVKPIKISLNKSVNDSNNQKKSLEPDEVELGEIVKPKVQKQTPQKQSNTSNEQQIPKLIIKPVTKSGQNQQQAQQPQQQKYHSQSNQPQSSNNLTQQNHQMVKKDPSKIQKPKQSQPRPVQQQQQSQQQQQQQQQQQVQTATLPPQLAELQALANQLNFGNIPPEILAQEALLQELFAQEAIAQANASLISSALPLLLLQAQNPGMNSPFDLASILNPPGISTPQINQTDLPTNSKKRKTIDNRDLDLINQQQNKQTNQTTKPTTSTSTSSTSSSNNSINKSKPKPAQNNQQHQQQQQQVKKEQNLLNKSNDFVNSNFNELLMLQQQQIQNQHNKQNRSSISAGDMNFDEYEQTNEYKWHQMRIRQEEESLKEQLVALNMNRSNSSSISPINKTTTNKTPRPNQPQQQQQQTQQQQSKTPQNLNQPSKPKKPISTPQQNKQEMDTIFTPTINNNSISTPNQQSSKKNKTILSTPSNIEAIDLSMNTPVIDKKQSTNNNSNNNNTSMKIIGQSVQVTEVASTQYWACPMCKKSDESSPMIACDSCDDWYHWHCIGIKEEPPKMQSWYCHKCGTKPEQSTINSNQTTSIENKLLNNPIDIINQDSGLSSLLSSLTGSSSINPLQSDYLSSLKKKKKKS